MSERTWAAAELATHRKNIKYMKSWAMHLVSVYVQTMAIWCAEGQLWIFEMGGKIIEKQVKINKESICI